MKVLDWDGHLLLLYRTEGERRAGVAAWVSRGLELGAKIVYTEPPDQASDGSLMAILSEHRVPSVGALARGQLEVMTLGPGLTACGQLDLLERALSEGYPGLRMSAQASTAQAVMSSSAHADLEWEVDRLCRGRPVGVLCQYPEDAVREVLPTVSAMHMDGVRQSSLQTAATPDGIVIAGEVDVSNRDILRSALGAATFAAPDSVVVDLSRLDFLDVSGGTALLEGTAGYRREGGLVRLRSPRPAVDRLLNLLAVYRVPGVTMEANGS